LAVGETMDLTARVIPARANQGVTPPCRKFRAPV
jgi:hypothetical protein